MVVVKKIESVPKIIALFDDIVEENTAGSPNRTPIIPSYPKNLEGSCFKNYQIVKELIEKITTTKGLKVVAWINEKIYRTGRKYTENFKENMTILFNEEIPKWNYIIKPL